MPKKEPTVKGKMISYKVHLDELVYDAGDEPYKSGKTFTETRHDLYINHGNITAFISDPSSLGLSDNETAYFGKEAREAYHRVVEERKNNKTEEVEIPLPLLESLFDFMKRIPKSRRQYNKFRELFDNYKNVKVENRRT